MNNPTDEHLDFAFEVLGYAKTNLKAYVGWSRVWTEAQSI